MAQDPSAHTDLQELEAAYKSLCEAHNLELPKCEKRQPGFSFSPEFRQTVRRFFVALSSVGLRQTLIDRASRLHAETAEGTVFANLWNAIRDDLGALRSKALADPIRYYFLVDAVCFDGIPLRLDKVHRFSDALQSLLQRRNSPELGPTNDSFWSDVHRLRDEAQRIIDEITPLQTDGCRELLLFGYDQSDIATDSQLHDFLDSLPDEDAVRVAALMIPAEALRTMTKGAEALLKVTWSRAAPDGCRTRRAASTLPQKAKKPRGRPSDTDRKADQRVEEAWKTGKFRTYAELASELGKPKREVQLAIGRCRKRRKSGRRAPE